MLYLLYIWVFWPFVCGVANQIRSGGLAYDIKRILPFWGPSYARFFASFLIAAPVIVIFSIYKYLVFISFLYIGFLFKNPDAQDMKYPFRDIIIMGICGLVITLPPGLACGLHKFAFCGAFMGFCYYLPVIIPLYHKNADGYLWKTSDWGAFLFGILLGFFVVLNISYPI